MADQLKKLVEQFVKDGKTIEQLRARIAHLQQDNASLTAANAEFAARHVVQLARIAELEAESKKHLEWAGAWHDALSVVATVAELPAAGDPQMLKRDIVEKLRCLSAENQRLRADGERLDFVIDQLSDNDFTFEAKQLADGSWLFQALALYPDDHPRLPYGCGADLRSAIDAARGAK